MGVSVAHSVRSYNWARVAIRKSGVKTPSHDHQPPTRAVLNACLAERKASIEQRKHFFLLLHTAISSMCTLSTTSVLR